MLHLEHTATLLQKIYFPEYITGYRLYLQSNGNWTSEPCLNLASILVEQEKIKLFIHNPIICTSQEQDDDISSITLEDSILIFYRNWSYKLSAYEDAPSWWPYCAKITIPPVSFRYPLNTPLFIGRKKDSHISLPNSGHCDNIDWKENLTHVDAIPTPSGNIPKNRFATDMINVSSHHGTFSLLKSNVLLACDSTQCPIFVRRPEEMIVLSPNDQNATAVSCVVDVNDEIFVGNHCFEIRRLPDKILQSPPPFVPVLEMTDSQDHETPVDAEALEHTEAHAPKVGKVVALTEQNWELSLHSTYGIKIIGWLLKGEQSIGNHTESNICIPENLSEPLQLHQTYTYARSHVRWNQGKINLFDTPDFVSKELSEPFLEQQFTVHRRSPTGQIDFSIKLDVIDDSPVPGGLLLKIDHRNETVNAMFHIAVHEEFEQIVQLCQHICSLRVSEKKLRIVAPKGVRLLQQHAGKWHANKTPHLELVPGELAIIDSIVIQFIYENVTTIDRPHSFGSPDLQK